MNIIQKIGSFASDVYNQLPDLSSTVKKCYVKMTWHTSKTKKDVYALASEERIRFARQKLSEAYAKERQASNKSDPSARKWRGSIFWQAELKRREQDFHWATACIKKMEQPIFGS